MAKFTRNPNPGQTRVRNVRPLSENEALSSLVNRFGPTADRLRQLATKFGVRPFRVFLTWTKWSGGERGAGTETVAKRIEILPTPRVRSLDSVALSTYGAGVIPVGSIQVDRISVDAFTFDLLTGHTVPTPHEDAIPEPYEFFYEVVEDGRGDPNPVRQRYRLMSSPARRAGSVDWIVRLERESLDRTRSDKSAVDLGTE